MKLTGRCKEEFFKWYEKQDYDRYFGNGEGFPEWWQLHPSMQYGVLVDFFEQECNIFIGRENMVDYFVLILFEDGSYKEYSIPDRAEAIKKADELFNEKFK